MARFCTACGTRNEADAAFCDQCGHPIGVATAAPGHLPPARAPGRRLPALSPAGRRAAIGIGAALLLGMLGWWGWQSWSNRLDQARATALATQWVDGHKSEWLRAVCLRNFNYVESPTRVGRHDQFTLRWLADLERLGIYEAMPDSGRGSRLFRHGAAASKYLRGGRLCLASDVALAEVLSFQAVNAPQIPALKGVHVVKVTLNWTDLPDFSGLDEVRESAPAFLRAQEHDILVRKKEGGGWVVIESDADLSPEARRTVNGPQTRLDPVAWLRRLFSSF